MKEKDLESNDKPRRNVSWQDKGMLFYSWRVLSGSSLTVFFSNENFSQSLHYVCVGVGAVEDIQCCEIVLAIKYIILC